ncbi:MAG: protein-tyrosine phosphatase family protein [Planctomycetota bacterium]
MRPILLPKLWIGNARDARDARELFDAGIGAVVDLAFEEPPAVLPREIVYLRFPLLDGSGNAAWLLRLAIESTRSLIASNVPTLVACSGGMSRSPAIAAAALGMTGQCSPDQSLRGLREHGPFDVSPGLWSDIHSLAAEPS